MKYRRSGGCLAAFALMVASSIVTHAQQQFPSKPIRIVSSQAGGSNDYGARLVAEELQQTLGQQVLIDNRAGGIIAGSVVTKSPPDGHTLLHYGTTLWLLPLLRDDVPYNPIRDFVPILGSISSINVLVVHPALPVKTPKDLIALARSRPGQLDYSSSAAGAANHLAAVLFESMANIRMRRIPLKGAAAAITSIATGEVQVSFPTYASVIPLIDAGKLRMLGVGTLKPTPVVPNAPTIASYLPGYEASAKAGFFAAAATPPVIINRLHREILAALNKPQTVERLRKIGVEVDGTPAQEFAASMQKDIRVFGKIFKEQGIRDE